MVEVSAEDRQLHRALSLGLSKLSEQLPRPWNTMARPLLRQAESQLSSISPGELRPKLMELRDLLTAALSGDLDEFCRQMDAAA